MTNTKDFAFTFKGRMFSLMVLELRNPNIVQLAMQLKEHTAQAPNMFQNTPVVLDISPLQDGFKVIDFPALVSLLNNHGLNVAGVVGGNAQQRGAASKARLALFPEPGGRGTAISETRPQAEAPAEEQELPTPQTSKPTDMVIRQPVRAGQQIYARGGDLIVEAAVNEGSEVIADGHIHVYGPLRGRALAGARGRIDARIWCQSLEAELVSIDGNYRTREDMDPALIGKPAVIEIQHDKMIIRALG